jgi:hypothetical protein
MRRGSIERVAVGEGTAHSLEAVASSVLRLQLAGRREVVAIAIGAATDNGGTLARGYAGCLSLVASKLVC